MAFHYARDPSGIVVVTMDMAGQQANTMTDTYHRLMGETLARLEAEPDLAGVVFASAKKTFFAGGDLHGLMNAPPAGEATRAWLVEDKGFLRRLERLPVPVVAAINGVALGGGFEICLACNHRIILDDPGARTGLPEVTLGLMPGAGGAARLPRLIALPDALDLLLTGRAVPPREALALGLVDALCDRPEALVPAAIAWIQANPDAHRQPWEDPPVLSEAEMAQARALIAQTRADVLARTRGKLPGPLHIIDTVEAGLVFDIDAVLALETRHFLSLLGRPETRAAIATNFFATNAVRSGKLRPPGPRLAPGSVAVIGAGPMGAAFAAATAGRALPGWITDRCPEAAARAQTGTVQAVADLTGRAPDLIIEAVPEDLELKRKVIRATFPRLAPGGIYATTTATLPLARLAEAAADPSRVLGLHVFGPLREMPLVEIVATPDTAPDALARAYDFVQHLRKTPILVRDTPGFFTRRVFATYLDESLALLADGLDPQAIEQAAHDAGMARPPFQMQDEAGLGPHPTAQDIDHPEGQPPRIRPGHAFLPAEAEDRLLYIQSIETLRCLNEGVLRSEAEADLGSILGLGYPRHTGGALQHIRCTGIERFRDRAAALAARWGDRFALPDSAYDVLRDGRAQVA